MWMFCISWKKNISDCFKRRHRCSCPPVRQMALCGSLQSVIRLSLEHIRWAEAEQWTADEYPLISPVIGLKTTHYVCFHMNGIKCSRTILSLWNGNVIVTLRLWQLQSDSRMTFLKRDTAYIIMQTHHVLLLWFSAKIRAFDFVWSLKSVSNDPLYSCLGVAYGAHPFMHNVSHPTVSCLCIYIAKNMLYNYVCVIPKCYQTVY